jgi:hypothetical protein
LCFGVVVWFFGAVFGWAFGCQRACGVCSRLLEMADFRPPPSTGEVGRGADSTRRRLIRQHMHIEFAGVGVGAFVGEAGGVGDLLARLLVPEFQVRLRRQVVR